MIQANSMVVCAPKAALGHHSMHSAGCGMFRCPTLPSVTSYRPLGSAHLRNQRVSRRADAACSLLAEQPCSRQDSRGGSLAHGTEKNTSPWAQLPGSPRGYRCRLCFETDFSSRGHLAEHLVGIVSTHIFLQSVPASDRTSPIVRSS